MAAIGIPNVSDFTQPGQLSRPPHRHLAEHTDVLGQPCELVFRGRAIPWGHEVLALLRMPMRSSLDSPSRVFVIALQVILPAERKETEKYSVIVTPATV